MTLRFGTDGVRGAANTELTPELALSLGRAAACTLGNGRWLVGRDTRRSGPLLHAAFGAGLASQGCDVIDLGVLPTPGVAHLSAVDGVPAAMISASHNAFGDNGIKIFAAGGMKLTDFDEERLEADLAEREAEGIPGSAARPAGGDVGTLRSAPEEWMRYAAHLEADALEDRSLAGVRVVLDCANGAVSMVAPRVFTNLGAEITVLHAEPDGTNINAGSGSNHPEALQRAVVARRAHLGLAFDGDADRVAAVDADGSVVDGDQIIALLAIDLRARGLLTDDTVVVTVMTNLGFRQAMDAAGIRVVETAVGDRNVLAALEAGGLTLGGEQSGHVILRHLATTGDGTLTGLAVCDVLRRSRRTLAELASVMQRLPQVLVNVRLPARDPGLITRLAPAIAEAETGLAGRGRVLVRSSGTEPMVRVMVEAPTEDEARSVADDLAAAVAAAGAATPAGS